jgi:hypothetical protein
MFECIHDLSPELFRQKNHFLKESFTSSNIDGNYHEGISNNPCFLTNGTQKKGEIRLYTSAQKDEISSGVDLGSPRFPLRCYHLGAVAP